MGSSKRRARKRDPLMVIRKSRSPIGGWIVHDLRRSHEVRTMPWKAAPKRAQWVRYPSHCAAVRAANRALRANTYLSVPRKTTQ